MESLNLLKEEINQTLDSEHDFAKWKLIVVAAVGTAALGLSNPNKPQLWLLLFIPFVCAYIDLILSQYQARILVLAQFIRGYRPNGGGKVLDTTLQDYEKYVNELRSRKGHVFDLGQFANRTASFGLSLLAPFVAAAVVWKFRSGINSALWWSVPIWLVLWLTGTAAIWVVWASHKRRVAELARCSKENFNVASGRLERMIQPVYSLLEIEQIVSFLRQMGGLSFPALPNGLFPAATGQDKGNSGYSYVWVRDNIHIAHAHYVVGKIEIAQKNMATLMQYFGQQQKRFLDIISGKANPDEPMNRPHVRFDGSTLGEINQKWAHAQNDALGYFLWMYCKLLNEGRLIPSPEDFATLDLFPLYFEKIRYWQDEDSGHWEETRKISASSIGAVIAGLQELANYLDAGKAPYSTAQSTPELVRSLITEGRRALGQILPSECVQSNSSQRRDYDAALLFLIYPLQVVGDEMADRILENTLVHLKGDYGIRRYLGDSYWAPNYKKKLAPTDRTVDFSDNLAARDRLLSAKGEEAQWSLFDPIISCIYGTRFKANTTNRAYLAYQTEYLNRSLAQITSEANQQVLPFRCPELYYLEDGCYVPNDHVPLLWTQANLMLALWAMKESCARSVQR